MVVQSDLNRIKALLTEAVTVLCKNALSFGCELNIEGLLGITLDKQDVFLVSINESFRKNFDSAELTEVASVEASQGATPTRKHGNCSSGETDKRANHRQPSSPLRIKQEYNEQPIILDSDLPQDLSRVKRPCREWSPGRKRPRSGAVYTARPVASPADTSMDPLDLIIKHERLSESEDCENMKNDISRQFNLSRPSAGSQTSSAGSSHDNGTTENIHIDKASHHDSKSDSSLHSAGWSPETAPFCFPGSLLPISNQTAFSTAIGTQAISQVCIRILTP